MQTLCPLGLVQVAVVFGARAGEVVVGGRRRRHRCGAGLALPPPPPPPHAAEVLRAVGGRVSRSPRAGE